jgi:5-methylcytosine-specific restriction endonuclease McrA
VRAGKKKIYDADMRGQRRILEERVCPVCGEKFKQHIAKQKYCSMKCVRKQARKKYTKSDRGKKIWREWTKKYRKRNRDKINQRCREKYAADPSRGIAATQRRRAAKRNALGRCSGSDLRTLKNILGDTCLKCGSATDVTWDHVIPLAVGGSDGPLNRQLLCRNNTIRAPIIAPSHK